MDFKSQSNGKCEYEVCNTPSRWLFLWMVRLFRVGLKRDLLMSDLSRCCTTDEPQVVTNALEREWMRELEKSRVSSSQYKPSLWKAIIRSFGRPYLRACFLTTLGKVAELAQPFLIGIIIMSLQSKLVSDTENSVDTPVILAAVGFISFSLFCALIRHRANIMAIQVGNNIRTAMTNLILKKILRMSTSSLDEIDVGQVMNILANDLNRIEELAWFLAFIPITPVMIIFVIAFTALYMGFACLGGIIFLTIFLLYQIKMSSLFSRFRGRTAAVTDQRVKSMSEMISSISVVKVYCWESLFASRIEKVRKNEIHHLRDTYILKGINNAIFFTATRLMVFSSYMIHVLTGHLLDSYTTFVTMSLYDSIKIPVTGFIPMALSAGAEANAGINRMIRVLLAEEREEKVSNNLINGLKSPVKGLSNDNTPEKGSIHVDRMTGRWTSRVLHDNLSDVSLKIEPGELIIIIGSVGAGKSCLLHALLGELVVTSGTIDLAGETAYAPQQPWVFGGTLRQNVLLGSEFDEERYRLVIDAACLSRDIKLLPDGDETYVGEKGYSLSGGQKARVSLARCLYRDASIYLLDDPLSAVDPKVANSIMQRGIKGFLKGKTTVLVTHQLQFLSMADRIVLLQDGKVKSFMSYPEMKEKGIDFGSVLRKTSQSKGETLKRQASTVSMSRLNRTKSSSMSFIALTESGGPSDELEDGFDEVDEEPGKPKTGEVEEQRTSGATSGRVYSQYFTIGGTHYLVFSVFTAVSAQILFHFNDIWLSAWTGQQELPLLSSNSNESINSLTNATQNSGAIAANLLFEDQSYNVIFYCSMMLIVFIFGFLRAFFLFTLCLRTSISMHNTVFNRLLRAPVSFYQNNSIGRILNRITRDMGQVDQTLPNTTMELVANALFIAGVVSLSVMKQPWLLFGVAALAAVAVPIRGLYIRTARDLQRLDSLARSPVYGHVSTAMSGLVSLRSFALQRRMEETFNEILVDSISARFHVMCASRFVGLYLDLIAVIYIILVTITIVVSSAMSSFSPSDAGLILSSSLQLMGFFQFAVRCSADFETQMISTERVLEYAEIESEAELQKPEVDSKHQDWPRKGDVVFDRVNMSYSNDTPPVLKDVSFSVDPEEKVGIVGRTGAGKSSLITALFRLNEIDRDKTTGKGLGSIVIDGLDVSTLGLHHLRSRISIIPQDPVLFSGTIRSNLDPFDTYSDHEVWNVLELSNLKAAVVAMQGELYAPVTEGGSNLSAGQRQLLCLARALLKRNRILVCDEATANVDKATDEIIQYTIKHKFQECTVLTIAHRLNTIIDMDRVLVLDAGQVVEYGNPYELLSEKESGHFALMVKQTGQEHSEKLIALAEKAYKRKQNRS